MMEDSRELLQWIHKNAAMGVGILPQAIALPQSRAMHPILQRQLQAYRTITAQARAWARVLDAPLSQPSPAALALSSVKLRTQSMWNGSTTKLAEQMIRGSTLGTVQMTRRLHQLEGQVEPGVMDLGRRLVEAEEQAIQEMKHYL